MKLLQAVATLSCTALTTMALCPAGITVPDVRYRELERNLNNDYSIGRLRFRLPELDNELNNDQNAMTTFDFQSNGWTIAVKLVNPIRNGVFSSFATANWNVNAAGDMFSFTSTEATRNILHKNQQSQGVHGKYDRSERMKVYVNFEGPQLPEIVIDEVFLWEGEYANVNCITDDPDSTFLLSDGSVYDMFSSTFPVPSEQNGMKPLLSYIPEETVCPEVTEPVCPDNDGDQDQESENNNSDTPTGYTCVSIGSDINNGQQTEGHGFDENGKWKFTLDVNFQRSDVTGAPATGRWYMTATFTDVIDELQWFLGENQSQPSWMGGWKWAMVPHQDNYMTMNPIQLQFFAYPNGQETIYGVEYEFCYEP